MKCLVYLTFFLLPTLNLVSQYSGIYTVCVEGAKNKTNFSSLTYAIEKIKQKGLKGDITLKVGCDIIQEPILIQNLSTNYNITIEPYKDSGCLLIQNHALNVMIQNSKNITFKSTDFVSKTTSYSSSLLLENSKNIKFEDCTFSVSDNENLQNNPVKVCALSNDINFINTSSNIKDYALNVE